MGAWGSGNFENDMASDWVYELFEPGDHLPYVEAGLKGAAEAAPDGMLDSPTGCVGLAAAEVIAAWLGKPGRDANDTVTVWAKAQKTPPSEDLVALARAAVQRVRGDQSELRDLWQESESWDDWNGVLDGLLERLG